MRCANFAIDDLCACCRRVPAHVRCDMLVYARAQMSGIRAFYLSRVADKSILNTLISRLAQPRRSCKVLCTPLAVAPHLE